MGQASKFTQLLRSNARQIKGKHTGSEEHEQSSSPVLQLVGALQEIIQDGNRAAWLIRDRGLRKRGGFAPGLRLAAGRGVRTGWSVHEATFQAQGLGWREGGRVRA
eukprot:743634-Pelagomonas_calceolata.AAC.5